MGGGLGGLRTEESGSGPWKEAGSGWRREEAPGAGWPWPWGCSACIPCWLLPDWPPPRRRTSSCLFPAVAEHHPLAKSSPLSPESPDPLTHGRTHCPSPSLVPHSHVPCKGYTRAEAGGAPAPGLHARGGLRSHRDTAGGPVPTVAPPRPHRVGVSLARHHGAHPGASSLQAAAPVTAMSMSIPSSQWLHNSCHIDHRAWTLPASRGPCDPADHHAWTVMVSCGPASHRSWILLASCGHSGHAWTLLVSHHPSCPADRAWTLPSSRGPSGPTDHHAWMVMASRGPSGPSDHHAWMVMASCDPSGLTDHHAWTLPASPWSVQSHNPTGVDPLSPGASAQAAPRGPSSCA